MHFAEIFFEDLQYMIHRDNIRGIVTEWHRVFPKLREVLHPVDIYSRYMQKDDLNEESGEACISTEEEASLSEPGLDFDDYESD